MGRSLCRIGALLALVICHTVVVAESGPASTTRRAAPAAVSARHQADDDHARKRAAEPWLSKWHRPLAKAPGLAVLGDDLPGLDRDLVMRLLPRLRAHGLRPVVLSAEQVANPFILTVRHFEALLLTHSSVYPEDGGPALERFLAGGGDLIALDAPAFREGVRQVAGRWLGAAQVRAALARVKPERLLWDMESGSATQWRHSAPAGSTGVWEAARPGAAGSRHSLHCTVPAFTAWNTLAAPRAAQPFAPGQTLTCLWARGGPATGRLALEWQERDGSRWIATIPLTAEWQPYVLTPDQFHYWRDNPSEGRGGPGDCLDPQAAVSFSVGIAMTHTALPAGRHEFWVDEIGVASAPPGITGEPQPPAIGPLEMVCPGYKFYSVTTAQVLRTSPRQGLLPPAQLPLVQPLMSSHPRPQGTGAFKDRKWRWIPLLEALDTAGEVCGTPACMVINRVGDHKDCITAAFGLPPAAYTDPALLELIATVAERMHEGVFLFEGGAQYYTYFKGEPVGLAASTIQTGRETLRDCRIRIRVTGDAGTVYEAMRPLSRGRAGACWDPQQPVAPSYTVECELLDAQGRLLDKLTHPLLVCQRSAASEFMQVRDGHFVRGGKRWIAHGVNYMPSSGMGTEDPEYFEYWLDPQPYDPVIIERDLRRIAGLGLNMVSIFCYSRSAESRNLLDVLERCRRHGLLVNLSLRPGTPLDFRWPEIRALIDRDALVADDTVLAYDLAWEPTFGRFERRRRWDEAWERWVVERYRSVRGAEHEWGVRARRINGHITGPSDDELTTEGPHRLMVCAYRRFLDDLLAKAHARAADLVRRMDRHHLISFRMSTAGDPTADPAGCAYDFRGLARSVDIMEPEGYGRTGAWERVRPGRFTVDWARCAAPGRPVLWAEFGSSTWDGPAGRSDPARETWAGEFYRRFYQMAAESDADGTVAWFYPGGYRWNERSDYGILNPDGSLRPVSRVIREWADPRLRPPEPGPVDEWITVDRDASALGLAGIYRACEKRYWDVIARGKRPGLRSDGHGLDSASAPRRAVGNVPYRLRRNPHKYLNAQFDDLLVLCADGDWHSVVDGDTVRIRKGDPVLVRASIGNTGEASWLAREGNGQVILTCGEAFIPIPYEVPPLGTVRVEDFQVMELQASTKLVFEMGAWPDVQFGEKLRISAIAE